MFMKLQGNDLADEIHRHNLMHVDSETSVLDAIRLMRQSGKAEVLVTDHAGGNLLAIGIVTANDIAARVIAQGLDPSVLTAGDITWSGMSRSGTVPDDAPASPNRREN